MLDTAEWRKPRPKGQGRKREQYADKPPLRIFFGKSLEPVTAEYEQRLATWNEWQPVSLEAFG